ncbi:MAG: Gfo/Idh/MocA family oxidoreductase [Actinomycetota bacterium]
MTVRVGFLGAGNIARYHARNVAAAIEGADVDARIVGVHDPADDGRAAAFVERFGGEIAGSASRLVDRADAVYVCTWTAAHPESVELAVGAGRAVFCEKPLGVDLATARRVHDALVSSARPHQVGLVLRRSPAFTVLRSLVQDEAAGAPMAILFRDDQFLPVQGAYASTWRGDRTLAGSGVLMEHSIHDIDLIEWMLGPIGRLSATMANHHGIDGIEDVATVSFETASGASGTLVTAWHDVLSRPSQRCVEVISAGRVSRLEGEWTGTISWEDAVGRHELVDDALLAHAAETHPEAANPDAAFLRCVERDEPCWPDAGDALRSHIVIDAAHRAARDHVVVDASPG